MMNTVNKTVGEDRLEISEISIQEELTAKSMFRSSWAGTHDLRGFVEEEGLKLAQCAYMIKKINDKTCTPLEAFDYILKLPKKHGDEIRLIFSEMNESGYFFGLLAQMAGKSSEADSSVKNTETSAGKTP